MTDFLSLIQSVENPVKVVCPTRQECDYPKNRTFLLVVYLSPIVKIPIFKKLDNRHEYTLECVLVDSMGSRVRFKSEITGTNLVGLRTHGLGTSLS